MIGYLRRFVKADEALPRRRPEGVPLASSRSRPCSVVSWSLASSATGLSKGLAWWNGYWTDPVANAAFRERVLRYNEDDVRANFVVKDWLVRFCAQQRRTGRLTLPVRIKS